MLALFPTYISSMNAYIIHYVILSYQVRFTLDDLTHGHDFVVLDITEEYKEVMKIYRLISY